MTKDGLSNSCSIKRSSNILASGDQTMDDGAAASRGVLPVVIGTLTVGDSVRLGTSTTDVRLLDAVRMGAASTSADSHIEKTTKSQTKSAYNQYGVGSPSLFHEILRS